MPRQALVIDSDPLMGRAMRALLEGHDWACTSASSVGEAIRALREGTFDAVVVSLSRTRQVNRLIEAVEGRLAEPDVTVVGVHFNNERFCVPTVVDTLLIRPTPPEALLAAVERTSAPRALTAEQVVSLLEANALEQGDGHGLERTAEQIRIGLSASALIISAQHPREVACAAPGAGERARGDLLERASDLVDISAPIIMSAVTTGTAEQSYEQAFETYVVASNESHPSAPRVSLCAVFPQSPGDLDAVRDILMCIARRVGQERGWAAVQQRLTAELDAVRVAGGLDPLLGIWSRGTLPLLLEMAASACRRAKQPVSIAVLNVVGMTAINDTYGHREGDALLRHIAEVAVYVVRGSDIVARYDGDDIVIVFPGVSDAEAVRVVERIQQTLVSPPVITDDGAQIPFRTTAGITVLGDDAERSVMWAAAAAGRTDERAPVVTKLFDQTAPVSPETRRSFEGVTFGGTYRVIHEIGSGGGGGVFRGEDLGLRRPVAIKVLWSKLAQNKEFLEQFRDEAATLAALRHPNLVQVYAFGGDDGQAYFVMELVEGESLIETIQRTRKERGTIPLARVRMVVRHISSALATLHRSGIIHRDVKPANMLLDPFRDRTVLVDVGIASRQGERARLAGTPGYMAPEAAVTHEIDPSADIYGLAATLYELITLTLPWPISDDLLVTLSNQRNIAPKPPSDHDPSWFPLDAPLLKALACAPAERWSDVEKFASAIDAALAEVMGAPVSQDTLVPASDASIGEAPTVSWTAEVGATGRNTRGAVFRALPRVVGARTAATWRLDVGRGAPRQAEALSPTTLPLGWLPTDILVELLQNPPEGYSVDEVSCDLGRAAVRSTFRRFFPASTATLAPLTTMSALATIWPHYHAWGRLLSRVAPSGQGARVILSGTQATACLCAWARGMLEQLVLLSGGDAVVVEHPECAAKGHSACHFAVSWSWDPASNRSWRAG